MTCKTVILLVSFAEYILKLHTEAEELLYSRFSFQAQLSFQFSGIPDIGLHRGSSHRENIGELEITKLSVISCAKITIKYRAPAQIEVIHREIEISDEKT